MAIRSKRPKCIKIEYQNGILSPQTWSRRRGLDYDQEQANLAQHNQRPQEMPGAELLSPTPGVPLGESRLEVVGELGQSISEGGYDSGQAPRLPGTEGKTRS